MAEDVTWHLAADRAKVGPDEAISVMIGEENIALCEVDGTVFAFHNICTHEYACLSDGFVEGDQIECPLHQARFHIPSGKALTAPAQVDLRTYPTKIEAGQVYVGTPRKV
jgi:nitrite reductase/ring-hydroxylating ferredoxin subunit